MMKRFGCFLISLSVMSAYATAVPATTNAPVSSETEQNIVNQNTAPLIFQMGKQKLLVTKADIVQLMPTQMICVDGINIQLSTEMASQLHDFTAQNLNQTLEILWNGNVLADATVSAPLGGSVCIGYVDQTTQQALVNAFGSTPATPATTVTTPATSN